MPVWTRCESSFGNGSGVSELPRSRTPTSPMMTPMTVRLAPTIWVTTSAVPSQSGRSTTPATATAAIRKNWPVTQPWPCSPKAGNRLISAYATQVSRSRLPGRHADHVEAAVDIDDVARDGGRQVRGQVKRGAGDVFDGDVAADGRHVTEAAVHRLEVAYA